LILSIIRFVEILNMLDYRNVGQTSSPAWRLHTMMEIGSLFAYFFTGTECLQLLQDGFDLPIYLPSISLSVFDQGNHSQASQNNINLGRYNQLMEEEDGN